MFARGNEKDNRPPEALRSHGNAQPASAPPIPFGSSSAASGPRPGPGREVSVIGRDLTILGQGLKIVCGGVLQVDGEVDGDLHGHEIVIGEDAKVTGLVNGERVTVRGTVSGSIRAMHVNLASKAHVEGDIHHQSLTIEQGAMFEGKSRRPRDAQELMPQLDTNALRAQGGMHNG